MMENYSLSDIAAVTDGNNNNGWGGNFGEWIILFLIFGLFGWGGFGGGFGGYGGAQGAADNYVLASDFATIQRQIDSSTDRLAQQGNQIANGLCDGFYTQAQLINGVNMNIANNTAALQAGITQNGYENRLGQYDLMTAVKDCCCQTQQNIKDTQYGIATTGANIQAAIKDCCCDNEKIAMQNRFDMAQYNCSTLQAIDKVGDRIIDYLAADKAQTLRDENQALRLAMSQAAQNNYLVNKLAPKLPVPAFTVPNPFAPYNNGCGCC